MSLRHALVSLSVLPIVIFSILPIPAIPRVFTAQGMIWIQSAHQGT